MKSIIAFTVMTALLVSGKHFPLFIVGAYIGMVRINK
jgi:hypothetical protein